MFAPIIWAAYAPSAWPTRVMLDDTGFRGAASEKSLRGTALFSVLGAAGYAAAGARPKITALQAVRTADSTAWAEFLAVLPGRPELVVTDGGPAILRALNTSWQTDTDDGRPRPRLRRCDMASTARVHSGAA